MAKQVYKNINGVARRCQKMYPGVGDTARKIKKGYIGVNGVARQFFQSEARMSNLSVGSSVFTTVNGVRTEFLIVQQGLPSSVYDSSCHGTWLLMKDIYYNAVWDSDGDMGYDTSHMHDVVNSILSKFSSGVQNIIKQVKIPYTDDSGILHSGTSGLSTKLFLLSYHEVGFTYTNVAQNTEGVRLSYFSSVHTPDADNKRIAYLNNTATAWWLRSPTSILGTTTYVMNDGDYNTTNSFYNHGVRPALIIPSTTLYDENFNILV